MTAADYLGLYAEGWTSGRAETVLRAVADEFIFDDPNAGAIPKAGFADYMSAFHEAVKSLTGGSLPEPLMELSEVLTQESDGILTAWCWWAVPGTELKGAGLIKVGAGGAPRGGAAGRTQPCPQSRTACGPG